MPSTFHINEWFPGLKVVLLKAVTILPIGSITFMIIDSVLLLFK